ncbi:hypothetical protein LX77_01470 [Gelidibacter algens]|jgi:hypothetical protein|uniref:Uncharacterized protein n=1 Tax=Gelidibacter algens TaxID=49280 RepID=A0A327S7Y8_9FLAO|nr:hypothetical protein LX77_01470 [Gelidibacter algens]
MKSALNLVSKKFKLVPFAMFETSIDDMIIFIKKENLQIISSLFSKALRILTVENYKPGVRFLKCLSSNSLRS